MLIVIGQDAAKEREAAQLLEVDEAEKAPSPSPRTGKPKAPGKKKARRAGSRSSSRASDSEEVSDADITFIG